MVIDIKMCRFDDVPWGFRLVGGSDFEYPVTVVKVHEGSIAEDAGLRDGDIIVRINDTAASPLTHDEVNRMIKHCGNVFYFGVQRASEDLHVNEAKQFPLIGQDQMSVSDSFLTEPRISQPCIEIRVTPEPDTAPDHEDEYIEDLPDRPCSVLSENTEIKLVEEEIAAVLSGESEVLKEHNVMGIFPKPGVCMSSDVLRTLNAEATKTKAERDKETKKWTTFLQKPNRPIPMSKQQLEAERRAANAYKVQIIKNSPRTSRSVSPAPSVRSVQSIQEQMPSIEETPPQVVVETVTKSPDEPPAEPEVEEPPPTDSEVPNLEQSSSANEDTESADSVATVQEMELSPIKTDASENEIIIEATEVTEVTSSVDDDKETADVQTPLTTVEKTDEELALERQLADVQKQLAALSSLPSTIQATLDAVTKQLADLLPTFKLQQVPPPRQISLERIEESVQDVTVANENNNNNNKEEENNEAERNGTLCNEAPKECDENINDDTNGLRAAHDKHLENGHERERQPTATMVDHDPDAGNDGHDESMMNMKKQKQQPHDVIEELAEHLERKKNPKRSKRAFGPLTPSSERPLVLPGGRRWYRPKDAYNDEFIAETLSAQAELIAGTALGSQYESPLLGYDIRLLYGITCSTRRIINTQNFVNTIDYALASSWHCPSSRVNFMKYQKPERKIDLNRSEVYKVIHHLDRQPVRGIEVRPPKVAAEVDVRKAIES